MRLLSFMCIFCLTKAVVQSQFLCEDEYQRFNDIEGGPGLCILIVDGPATWEIARKTCARKLAFVANLDRLTKFEYYTGEQQRITITGDLRDRNITEFWTGMHLNEQRLMWDDLGPKLVIRNRRQSNPSWSWKNYQPDPKFGECGKASLIYDRNDILRNEVQVALEDCQQALPFVCQKSPTDLFLEQVDVCPDGFLGNTFLSHCYKISDETKTYTEADKACKTFNNGMLAKADSSFNKRIVDNMYRNSEVEYVEVIELLGVWVENLNESEGLCTAFVQEIDLPPTFKSVPCNSSNMYVCAVPVLVPEKPSMQASSVYFNQDELLNYPPFMPLPIKFSLNRKQYRNEVFYIRTPVDILNSTEFYYKWDYSLTYVNWNIKPYVESNGNYAVNITIPQENVPQKRRKRANSRDVYDVNNERQRRQIVGTTPRFPDEFIPTEMPNFFTDYDYVRISTGYYGFEFNRLLLPRYSSTTGKRLVRYSEKDLYIYVAYLGLKENTIRYSETEAVLSIEDSNSFNMLQDESYLIFLQEYTNSILKERPMSLSNVLTYYRGQIEYIDISKNMIKVRYFAAPFNGRQLPEEFESTVSLTIVDHLKQVVPEFLFDNSSVQVYSTVKCEQLNTVIDGKKVTIFPVRTGQSAYSSERCYPARTALATATCTGGYDDGTRWSDVVVSEGCGDVPQLNQSESTQSLQNLSETTITQTNYLEIIRDTIQLTKINLTEADVIYTADIITKYLSFSPFNTEEILNNIYEIINNVLYTKTEFVVSAQKITNAANRIIESTEILSNGINLQGKNSAKVVKDFLACVIVDQSGSGSLTIGIKLDKTTNNSRLNQDDINNVEAPSDIPINDIDTAIYLSRNLAQGEKTRLVFQLYSQTDLYSVIGSQFKVNSKVAAARMTRGDRNIENLGDEYVTTVFTILEKSENLVCAYWNYSASENAGGWETNGCMMNSSSDGRVVCKCNHLTNFAVLIDLNAGSVSDADKLALGIITKIGLIISIVCLGITILTYIVFSHLRKGRGQQVLVNLSVAMLCSAILFLVGVERTENRTGCIVVAALLHYFILVTFMWMLVEGLLQYLRFVKVLGTYIPNFMKKSMIPAWGLPLIPVIVILALDYNLYFGGNGYCWLSWDPFLYAFLIPVALIILANLIVFIMVMCNLCCRKKHKGMASNQSERKMAFLHVQAGVSILVILGLTWLFGFLTVDATRIVFHYLFAIFNAFQGFFIFLLFTFREPQIRKAWKKICCRRSPYKATSSGTDSGPRKNASTETRSTGFSKSSEQDKLTFKNPHFDQ